MKTIKRLSAIFLALVMILTMIPAVDTKAASTDYPTKFRIYDVIGYSETRIEIPVPDADTSIDNVKSKNSNLMAEIIGYYYSSSNPEDCNYSLGLSAKKQGTYDLTYDVMKKGKKVKTVKAKVYAYANPITIDVGGCKGNYYGSKKDAKLTVNAAKGNKIKKIEVGTFKESKDENGDIRTDMVFKTVKNKSKISLGTIGSHFESDFKNEFQERTYKSEEITSQTRIRVTYTDKYVNRDEEVVFYYFGIAK